MLPETPPRALNLAKLGFMQYHKALHRFLMRRLRNAEDAADLAQEVYLRMLRVENSELVRSPRDYLYGIASHVVYQFKLRAKRDVVEFDSAMVDDAMENPHLIRPDELTEDIAAPQHLLWALEQLSPMQRAVLLLRKRDELSKEEIAKRLNLSTHTVKKYLFQAQARMRVLWHDQGGGR